MGFKGFEGTWFAMTLAASNGALASTPEFLPPDKPHI